MIPVGPDWEQVPELPELGWSFELCNCSAADTCLNTGERVGHDYRCTIQTLRVQCYLMDDEVFSSPWDEAASAPDQGPDREQRCELTSPPPLPMHGCMCWHCNRLRL
jgi:hypothetical protein